MSYLFLKKINVYEFLRKKPQQSTFVNEREKERKKESYAFVRG